MFSSFALLNLNVHTKRICQAQDAGIRFSAASNVPDLRYIYETTDYMSNIN